MKRLRNPIRKLRSRRASPARRRLTGWEALEERTVLAAGAFSHVAIDPPGTLASASTFSNGSFTITNNSTAGQQITSVSFDLSTAMFPDMVFDPNGGAGDLVAKGFTVNSNSGVGLTGHAFSGLHDDGFDVLTITFNDFDPGETLTFSVDVDPTSIRGSGSPGPNESGSVSGLELVGAAIMVHYSDGTEHLNHTYRIPSSVTGSAVNLRDASPAAPGLSVVGLASTPAVVAHASQTLRITGPAGAPVALLRVEGGLYTDGVPGGGFDLNPFEANTAVAVQEIFATIGSTGLVDVPVTLTKSDPEAGINYLAAVVQDAAGNSQISPIIALEYDPSTTASSLSSSPESASFGKVLLGKQATQTVQLTNAGSSGGASITIDPAAASLSGAGASQFSFVFPTTNPIVLAPGQSTSVNVTFAPTTEGAKSAALGIVHSGSNSPLSISLSGEGAASLPIGFQKTTLASASLTSPTSLQFGPDDRLYVAQQDGIINIFTVVRNGVNDYGATATETITAIHEMPNRDDDGALNPSVTGRLVTGLLVAGTAANPVIYVTSSDPRISVGSDLHLDTNSGIISRLTWTGAAWEQVDLVRGLPRSEENHASNGMALDPATNTLYVAQGGNTNMGAPSNNFALLPEYALSAAILSIDLGAIGNSTYDLPTLDDEDQPGADATDPFGGNDGKNQAKLVPGGPVQVYAPGFRNPYDVVLTKAGRLYTIDNGPNAGWGDVPINEGPEGNATNDPNEPGVTHGDGLHLITGPGYYGGHPNPTRSNPNNTFNSTDPQSPVSVANPVESDYREPGVEDGALRVFPASTNGLTEYTASNFGGAMQGNLLAAAFDNTIKRIVLNGAGDAVTAANNLFSTVGSLPLDVVAQGDHDVFPGTIWAADYVAGTIVVFEPNDFDGSGGGGTPDDLDGDGYSNDDEIANGTDPNNAADFPPDWDQDFLSNLLDLDDDNDGLPDTEDPFAIDPHNGLNTPVGVSYTWENDAPNPGGLFNLGFTGLMTNGVDDYEDLFDATLITAGGAAGVLTVDQINAGDATGAANDQQYAFQFGVNTTSEAIPFTAHTRVLAPLFGSAPENGQSLGMYLGNGDQDNYLKIVVEIAGGAGQIRVQKEVAGAATSGATAPITIPGPSAIDFYLTVDPLTATVQPAYAVTTGGVLGAKINVGAPQAIPRSWFGETKAMAVGVIGSAAAPASPFPGTWDFLEVLPERKNILAPSAGQVDFGSVEPGDSATRTLTLRNNGEAGDPDITISSLDVTGPNSGEFSDSFNDASPVTLAPGESTEITLTFIAGSAGAKAAALAVSHSGANDPLQIELTGESASVVYRINAGGPQLTGESIWEGDVPSIYSNVSASGSSTFTTSEPINLSHPSIPAGTPMAVFQSERFDPAAGEQMRWSFPVSPGNYEVRLYFADIFNGTHSVGARVFDVEMEGVLVLDDYDIFARVGGFAGIVETFLVSSDSTLNIDFRHVVENPVIKGIEILTASTPNQAPAVGLANTLTKLSEDADLSSPVKVADIVVTDDGQGVNTLSLSGPDAAMFEIVGTTLQLKAGSSLSSASNPVLDVTVEVDDATIGAAPDDTASLSITVTPRSGAGAVIYRVNAGGSQIAGDPLWEADAPSVYTNASAASSSTFSTATAINLSHASIPAGAPENLFKSQRWDPATGAEMQWDFPVEPGLYEVRLYFADIFNGTHQVGARLFDVSIEGALVLDDYDIFAEVGGFAGVVKAFTVDSDANLDVDFFHVVENPIISAIEILSAQPVNQPPTVSLAGAVTSLSEDADTSAAIKVADIVITDDGLGTNVLSLSGEDAALFEIVGAALQLKAGAVLNFDTNPVLNVTVEVDDAAVGAAPDDTASLSISVTGVNSPPTVSLTNTITSLSEGADTSSPIKVADIVVSDDGTGVNELSLSGADAAMFEIVGTALQLKAGSILDASSNPVLDVTVAVDDASVGAAPDDTASLSISVTARGGTGAVLFRVNAGGAQIADTPLWEADQPSVYTNASAASSSTFSTSTGINLSHASIPAGTPEALFKSQRWDSAKNQEMQWNFPVEPGEYEVRLFFADIFKGTHQVGARMFDVFLEGVLLLDDYDVFAEVGAYAGVMKAFTVSSDANLDIDFAHVVENPFISAIEIRSAQAVNQPPAVSLANATTSLAEDADTSSPLKVADIVISDDGSGVNVLSLSGPDAALFEIVGTALQLKAGVTLDADANPVLDVTVEVDDASVGASPDDAVSLSITVTEVNQPPTVSLANATTSLAEDADTSRPIKVADIVVSDDGSGVNTLSLSGPDAALFEIVGAVLQLKAGSVLNASSNPVLDVTVAVDDPSVGAAPDDTASLAISVTAQGGTGAVLFRVNAGGAQIADTPSWEADRPSVYTNASAASSSTFSTSTGINLSHASIPAGTPEALFKSQRWDSAKNQEMQWNFPVEPGEYEVRLFFADIFKGTHQVGARMFDVFLEGVLVLDDYDVFAEVGGFAGVVKTFLVTSDANLDIDFAHVVENPFISAIEIRSAHAVNSDVAEFAPASDPDGDGGLTANDLLMIVNHMRDHLASPFMPYLAKFDVDRDGALTLADVLWVVQGLLVQLQGAAQTAAPEGEEPSALQAAALEGFVFDPFSEDDEEEEATAHTALLMDLAARRGAGLDA